MPPATAPRIFRPHRHTAVLPMDGSERRCQRLQETFRRTASCRRADHGKSGKSCRHFALVSRGHRSDRTPPRESPRHFAARMDESVIVGYYTSAEVHPRSPARLLLSKERKKPMARNDGIDRTFARNQDLPTLSTMWRKFRSITSEKKTATPIKILIPPRPTAMSTSRNLPTAMPPCSIR